MPVDPPPRPQSRFTRALAGLPGPAFALFAAIAAFSCYFSMYAFRKPFTAAAFDGQSFLDSGITLKTAFVLSQIFGYTLSKYLGVKVCSETTAGRRGATLVGLVLAAQVALLLFALLPGSWKTAAMFLNGLPLGMVWGLVVAYLEGRRCSDFVMAALCGSFIVASAAVKDVGRWLMDHAGVAEAWMPAATGALFLPVFALAVWCLSSLPPPTDADRAARQPRATMDKSDRRAFLRRYAPGLIALLAFYFFLTAYRDFRDNYGIEIFRGLGYGSGESGIFSRADVPVAVVTLLALALLTLIKNNRLALFLTFGFMLLGMGVLLAASFAMSQGWISGLSWMIATGLGTYLAFAPINAVLFERLMAATGSAGTAVFGIQLADSIGYTGAALIQVYKDLGTPSATHLDYFSGFTHLLGAGGLVLVAVSAGYFLHATRPSRRKGLD